MEEIDPMTGLPIVPMQPNRAGVPPRSMNDMSQMGSIVDPGMQSAKQAEDFNKFNTIAMKLDSEEFEMLDGKKGKSSADFAEYKKQQYKEN